MAKRIDGGIRIVAMAAECPDVNAEPCAQDPLRVVLSHDFSEDEVCLDADGARILARYLVAWADGLPSFGQAAVGGDGM